MKYLKLLLCISSCLAIGILGSFVTIPSIASWYMTLNKPFFSPPNWIFGPVWTTLYILMGMSLFLFLDSKTKKKKSHGLVFFGLQLFLNFFWSYLFFYFHQPLLAFIEVCLLWFMIYVTIDSFRTLSKRAAVLLVPYIVWVSFASILNLAIVVLN